MKLNKNLQIITSFLIITSIVVLPFLNVKKISAQSVNYGASFSSGNNSSLSGYLGDLSGLITNLPGCTSTLEGGVSNLFGKIKNIFKGKNNKVTKYTSTEGLTDLALDLTTSLNSIPTSDTLARQQLQEIKAQLGEHGKTLDKVETSTSSVNKNQTCLNAIGKAVIKMIIDRMTVSIVNWINTGNSGDPFFVTNPSEFFKDIAKEQLLMFGQEINDPKKFPFGKSFMLNAVGSFNNTFQQNAAYSMDKIMQQQSMLTLGIPSPYTPEDFMQDFTKGGWDAWNALTQYPQNNPLGFQLIASNELQKRLAGTELSPAEIVKDQLAQANGFLSQERCADPIGVTREEDAKARNGEHLNYQTGTSSSGMEYQSTYTQTIDYRICKRWEIVTPGVTIAETLTRNMSNSENSLLDADTLNDAIAAILDAALAKLSSTLMNEGLSSIDENTTSLSYDVSNYEDGGLSSYDQNQTDRDFSNYQRDASPWLKSHPNFDIRKDINQALIDEQRIYIQKIKEQNEILPELIEWIYQLDYCIPGPNPNWEEEARRSLNKITKNLSEITSRVEGISETTGYDLLGTFTAGIGTAIIDWGNSAMDCGDDSASKIGDFIKSAFITMTGLQIPDQAQMCTLSGFNFANEEILDGYSRVLKRWYNSTTLPSMATEAKDKFSKAAGYERMVEENSGAIAFQEGIIKRLENVKTAVENLNYQLETGVIDQNKFEEELIIWKNSFARLSSGLVSGGDIAHVDSLTKEAYEEMLYVKNDLLQGPAGCEQELKKIPFAPWQLAIQIRPDYPKPHFYNYDKSVNESLNGTNKGFLTSAVFGEAWGDLTKILNPVGSIVAPNQQWVTDLIDLHKEQTGAAINFDQPYWGGHADIWEKALGIY